jgi:hypothetical protein
MLPEFTAFNVEVKNLRFTTDEGRKYPKTAILTLVSPDGHSEYIEMLGYIDDNWIFDRIEKKESLVLDNCYIEDLSLADYRFRKGLDTKHPVKINGFSANSAFFNNKTQVDLSYAEFTGGYVSFERAWFARSSLNMHAARIMGRSASGGPSSGTVSLILNWPNLTRWRLILTGRFSERVVSPS